MTQTQERKYYRLPLDEGFVSLMTSAHLGQEELEVTLSRFVKKQEQDGISMIDIPRPLFQKEEGRPTSYARSKFKGRDGLVKSSKPIELEVYQSIGDFYAECESIGVYVSGSTLEMVLEEFDNLVVEFYYFYKKIGEDAVGGAAKSYKRKFEQYFELID